MTKIVNKFEYQKTLLVIDKILRTFAESSPHLCADSTECLKYVRHSTQYAQAMYKVLY